MDVSIIIVNWNTSGVLYNCLRSIYEQTEDLSFEVIVVDNASSDESVEMVRKNFPDLILIENHKNVGYPAANNQGMAIARGRYVLVLNPDTVILNNAIAKAVKFLDERPEAAVAGCQVLNPNGTLQRNCCMEPSLLNLVLALTHLYKIFPNHHFFARERMGWWDYANEREVDIVMGCFMLVRKAALDIVGGMDEHLFMYSEDVDWCRRFRNAGWKVMYTPGPEIVHYMGQASNLVGPFVPVLKVKSSLYYYKKHRRAIAYLLYRFFTGLFYFVRLPYWALKALSLKRTRREYAAVMLKTYISVIALAWAGRREVFEGAKRRVMSTRLNNEKGRISKRILLVASQGGHFMQMWRLWPAFLGHDLVFISTSNNLRDKLKMGVLRTYTVNEACRWNKMGLIEQGGRILRILLRERPDIVISTGASCGFFALFLGKLMGAKTIWLDSIANSKALSLSGKLVRPYADLWLTQWPQLAKPQGPRFTGNVL